MNRVPTVSFVVADEKKLSSKDIVALFDKKGNVSHRLHPLELKGFTYLHYSNLQMGIRYGHFYAYTLVDSLQPKLDVNDGVVRISLVHYNTVEEVQTLIEILKEALV